MAPAIGGSNGSRKEVTGNLSFWTQDGKNVIIAWGQDNQAGIELAKHKDKTAAEAGIDYLEGTDGGNVDGTKGIRYDLDPNGVLDVTIRNK